MTAHAMPTPLTIHRSTNLRGTAEIPGDKSVSHRALIFGAMAIGETVITGLLEGEDVLDTAKAMRALGATVARDDDGTWRVHGVGTGGFMEPNHVIDCGNSGTGCRLIMGAVATHPFATTFTGDASLRSRPMGRILDPLALFGTTSAGRSEGRLPLTLIGARDPLPVTYTLPVASAQVKSAVLLAGLNAPGTTTVIEPEPTRDHTERMLRGFGATVDIEETPEGRAIHLYGQPELNPCSVAVPRDPSSAAFPVVAALLTEGSEIHIPGVSRNPTRDGLYRTLIEMGGDLSFTNDREEGGEPVADLTVRHSVLSGVTVPAERAASMIDEYPILSVAAAFATGSDRIMAMEAGLQANGVTTASTEDTFTVTGHAGNGVPGGATVATHLDHRIAMSFAVMGMAAEQSITIDDATPIATSFPTFQPLMNSLSAQVD